MALDVARARAQFPSLKSGFIYAENAGGSQCIQGVVDRISDYLLNTNVQLGAAYATSVSSTKRVADGAEVTAKFINAASPDEIAFGSSSTALMENLTRAIEGDILDGEEIIVTGEHEANGGPWKKLAKRRGLVVKLWEHSPIPGFPNNPYAVGLFIDQLTPLITNKTRIVAFTACSNILGTVIDVEAVTKHIRGVAAEKGARRVEVCIDCVAYAPHRRIDVRKWDVDYCFFSYYKVYGPHIAAMYLRSASLEGSLTSLAHHFLKVDKTSYKIEPGGAGYELVYATTGVVPYLESLSLNGDIDESFSLITAHEQKLVKRLLDYLTSDEARSKGVLVVGDEAAGPSRVPTISFVVTTPNAKTSLEVVDVFDKTGKVGIRNGHMYAYTVCGKLRPPIDMNDGVVRISLVHYNTLEEVDFIIGLVKEAIV